METTKLGELELSIIPAQFVHARWSGFCEYLGAALANGPWAEYTLSQMRTMLSRGECLVFVTLEKGRPMTPKGAIVVQIMNYPASSVCHVLAIGGKGVNECWPMFLNWCRGNGITRIRGHGKASVARLWRKLGLRETCRVVEMELS
jgi:hypothetical protein